MRTAVAAGLLSSVAIAAQAQGSVTIGGVADASVRSVHNQDRGSVASLASGANSTSKLIIRGTEDLGGGLSAGFWLEQGILLDSGSTTGAATNQTWDRRATVSLVDKRFGELRLGRDFVPTYLSWSRYDPFSYVGIAGSTNVINSAGAGPIRSAFGTGSNTAVRSDNGVQYWTPGGLGGFEGQIMVAPRESSNTKVYGGRVGYGSGSVYVSAARMVSENATTATTGKFTDSAVGGSYTFSFAKVSAAWRQFKQASSKQTNTMVSAVVPVGDDELKFSFIRIDLAGRVGAAGIDANDARLLGLGYVHNLSKRSALYGTFARITNGGAAVYAVPGGPTVVSGGKNSTGYELGLRHNF